MSRISCIGILFITAVILSACTPGDGTPTPGDATPEVTAPPPPQIVRVNLGRAPVTLDPLLVGPLNTTENDLVENLFAGLTRLDGDTGKVEPALASSWETSEDGTIWRVTLRDDIFWVRINPDTSQMETVRPITASDVVFTVRRACRASATVAPMLAAVFLIKGCGEVNRTDPAVLTDEQVETVVGVRALNDITIEFALVRQAAYFPTVMSLPVMRPLPADRVAESPDDWHKPDKLYTSGPYVAQPGTDLTQGMTLVANTFWPLEKSGNVDGVQISFGDAEQAYNDWQSGGDFALVTVPPDQVERAPFDSDARFRQIVLPATTFLVAAYDTPPLDNAEIRRALSRAVDRDALIKQAILPASQTALPAFELAPPGSAGAPPYASIGQTYDSEAAQAAFASEGYSGCRGLPEIVILTDPDAQSIALGSAIADQWTATFGCPNGVIRAEQADFTVIEALLKQPPDLNQPRRAGFILLRWQADYPDTIHWLADIVGCRAQFPDAYLNQTRGCDGSDQRIASAAETLDEQARTDLYAAVEEAWFGASGEMPVIPLTFLTRAVAVSPWLAIAPVKAGPLRFDLWLVDEGR